MNEELDAKINAILDDLLDGGEIWKGSIDQPEAVRRIKALFCYKSEPPHPDNIEASAAIDGPPVLGEAFTANMTQAQAANTRTMAQGSAAHGRRLQACGCGYYPDQRELSGMGFRYCSYHEQVAMGARNQAFTPRERP